MIIRRKILKIYTYIIKMSKKMVSVKNNAFKTLCKIVFYLFLFWVLWFLFSKIVFRKKEGYFVPLGQKEFFKPLGCDPKKDPDCN